jgi:GT2 family glycosyltransferase
MVERHVMFELFSSCANMDPEVAIITLNWNGWQDTLACLASLNHIEYDNYRIILIDNDSTDDSLAKIDAHCTNELNLESYFTEGLVRNKFIKVVHYTEGDAKLGTDRSGAVAQQANDALTVIKNDKNYGFAEGSNIGVAYALNAFDPDYILILNNDTVVDRHFLRALVDVAENDEQIGLLQPKMLRYADALIDNTGSLCDRLAYCKPRGLGEMDAGQYDRDQKDNFFYVAGACMLVRKSVLLALSGECFDPYLFAYYEDVDLSWMARLLGFKVGYCPDSVCYHKGSATFGKHSPFIAYLSDRNRLRVLIKNYALPSLFFVLPLTIVLKCAALAAECFIGKDPYYIVSFIKALAWNALQLRNTLTLRRRIQSKRNVSDNDIVKHMIPFSFNPHAELLERWRHQRI